MLQIFHFKIINEGLKLRNLYNNNKKKAEGAGEI